MRPIAAPARRQRALILVAGVVGLVGATAAFAARPGHYAPEQSQDTAPGLADVLQHLSGPDLPPMPQATAFHAGSRTVAATEHTVGPLAVSNGTVDIYGSVDGDVVTFRGDIVVHAGGTVSGNAIAIGGKVRVDGGQVRGQSLELSDGVSAGAPEPASAGSRILSRLALVGGWLTVLLVISIGVLVLASDNLAAVADALERHYGSTLVAGVAGQVAFAPLLVAILVALVLSVLGILLVPFAAVAYIIIAAGLVTLGYLATAVVIGRGWRPAPPGSDLAQRAATLRALVVGVCILLSPWAVAALLAPWPVAESLARGAAFAMTWVACTAGLGAALISRAGIRRAQSRQAQRAMAAPGWQTPTPVAGVVAARRPAATHSAGSR